MERVGTRDTGRAAEYVNEALREISDEIPFQVKRITLDVQAGARYYELPEELVELRGVFQKDFSMTDSILYRRIPRVVKVDVFDEGATEDTIVVIPGGVIGV
jgi:ribosome maturation protein Sdo1